VRRLLIACLFAAVSVGSAIGLAFADSVSKDERRELFLKGAKLWPIYCNQCHNARPPGEKAPYEWDQEIMHMRMLGNIPADDARALLQYLKSR
jgi:hypothetical protein